MRVSCYFAHRIPEGSLPMWRIGWLTDKHAACPAGLAVVVGNENDLYVPDACGRVDVFDNGSHDTALGRLVEQGSRAGYRLRLRASSMGLELPELDTPVLPFVVQENSILAQSPESPIWAWLRGPNRVYEGDDGEFYLQDPAGRWFHYLDERLVEELLKSGS
jgi:hypothetical protein